MLELDEIEFRLSEAALTEHRLPDKDRRILYKKNSNWPDFISNFVRQGLDWEKPTKIRIVPSAKDISDMEEVLDWLTWISKGRHKDPIKLTKIIWARSNGCQWKQVAYIAGCSPMTCQRWYLIGLRYLQKRLKDY